MDIKNNLLENIDQNNERSINTDLFNVLMNLRDARTMYNDEYSIKNNLLEITMDTHGPEVTEELIQMCKKDHVKLFDVLVELHGIDIINELIYTHGKKKGRNFGKQLGKCKNPGSAIKRINENIQCNQNVNDSKNLHNNKKTTSLNPLHINTQGFIEGALSFMTGMQTNIAITDPNENRIYFKSHKKHFFGIF